MAVKRSSRVEDTSDREMVLTRTLDAPRELVFEAWTDPKQVALWWGPRGFTNTIHKMDVRPGGVWRFIMHGPDGVDYKNRIVFIEVVKPERLVYDHGDDDGSGQFHVTVTFAEERGKTKVTLHAIFATAAERDGAVKSGAVEGGNQTLERLAEHLARTGAFVVTRVFDAPRERVWRAWTEIEGLKRWWGPKGFAMGIAKLDLRPGGIFHYSMRPPDGRELWGRFIYREIVPPERLVFVLSFSDAKGGVTRHWLSPTWPLEVLTTVTLAERAGRTALTLRAVPINATEEERKTFEEGFGSMQQGFGGTFDQLDDYLATG